ncbi:DUF3048 domain-containing protein [Xylanimonas oleitrophica]|uniref:DUF3048 domain-containing protein n=1 Tax=Xylanimonas oleitrophica TaxID=2607479 RepID=A0A2W5XQK0_9MICO|nr:DUF3048 domain-containing protein [Xylanimonas oleitrophica]PZR51828.1 DUF3048 domain-containing protein [Xylanimonas oleitrophica]
MTRRTAPAPRRTAALHAAAVTGALALALALAACSGGAAAVHATADPDVAARKGAPPAPQAEPSVWPLTGVPTDEVAQRPALAIKIENSREARPQTGLELADIVWEEVVEGGITRYVAVYHSQIPEAVEPVRSARPMDPAIVAPLGGILAYSGAQPQFIDAIEAAGVQSVIMDRGDAGFARDRARRAPHNVVGTPQAFLDQARGDRAVPPPAQFEYAAEVGQGTASATGTPAQRLDVSLSRAQRTVWDWDGEQGTYLRSDGSTPSVSTTGARHAARNVLLLSAEMVTTKWRDPAGSPVPETKIEGTGQGVLASGGKAVEVTWSKPSLGERIVLTGADGTEVRLDPGTTWVELVPRGSGSWTVG